MKVTSIVPHRRLKNKVVVILQDDSKFVVSLETIYRKEIKKDCDIDEEMLSEIECEENYQRAKNRALKYLERGDKPFKMVHDYLVKKEFSPVVIKKVMEFLQKHSFVDDDRYAKRYIDGRKSREGRTKLRYALKRKGINEDIIESYLSTIDVGYEVDGIQKIIEKKIGGLISKGKDKREIKSKLYSYIASKGFSGENVLKCINEAIIANEESILESQQEKTKSLDDIYEVAQKRLDRISKSESNKFKQKKKLYDFLMRKGYSYDEIKSVLNEIL